MKLLDNEATFSTPKTAERGCFMTQGLYLKANGEMPCWDDVGESKILRQLDPKKLEEGGEIDIYRFGALKHIRTEFAAGRLPYPGLCDGCAVRCAGIPEAHEAPNVMQVLHVEPSYLCHLSCPQCIPQKLRKSLKHPPYHLTPEMYEGFLRQLRAEGVSHIKLVIFEGRGDPLACPHIEQLLDLTKVYYPRASTSITTHGSYPYKSWIASSKLDVMRFSVDGARQANYANYRIGGKLPTIFKFMESLQKDRRPGSAMYVEWKYILFEWNDEDEELAEAGELALRYGVQLRFCRTHSPGKSQKYETSADVAEMIDRVAPRALQDMTFQLKEEADFAAVDVVRIDQMLGAFVRAEERAVAGDEAGVVATLCEVINLDGGAAASLDSDATLAKFESALLPEIGSLRLGVTASNLANFLDRRGYHSLVGQLLQRYLALEPDAADRDHVEGAIGICAMLDLHRRGDTKGVDIAAVPLASAHSDARGILAIFGPAATITDPGVAVGLANILYDRGHVDGAILLFERYLELAPYASDVRKISQIVAALQSDRLMKAALRQQRAGNAHVVPGLIGQAVAADRVAHNMEPTLVDAVASAAGERILALLSALAVEAGNYEAAYHAERRLRGLTPAAPALAIVDGIP
ncbi:hypothetical protein [Sphingomonas sp. UYEF23]|uniref:hypothetical protein n=1 Tax=Sphingomonas sp. UYEF23 TaxID=1756408 RepID=UPI0033925FD6